MIRRVLLVLAGLFLLAPIPALATPWVAVGVSAWNTGASGTVRDTSSALNTNVNLENDLHLGHHWNGGLHVTFDDPLPLLPDLRLSYDRILSSGSGITRQSFTFGGNVYNANGQIQSQALLRQGSVLLFWNPLDDSLVNWRFGFEARWIKLNVAASGQGVATAPGGGTQPYQVSGSAGGVVWLPLLDTGVTLHLPAGFEISGDAAFIHVGSSYLYDARAGLGYSFGPGLSASVGYRRLRVHLESSRISLNGTAEFSGVYAGLGWHF